MNSPFDADMDPMSTSAVLHKSIATAGFRKLALFTNLRGEHS